MHMSATGTYHVLPPEKFDFSHLEDWPKQSRWFERFRKASDLNLKEEEMQVNTLFYSLGEAIDDVLCSFNLSEEDAKNYMIMVRKFEQHFVRRHNVICDQA